MSIYCNAVDTTKKKTLQQNTKCYLHEQRSLPDAFWILKYVFSQKKISMPD